MATEDFVPVACDDWYQRRRKDAEGDFFREVSDQSPRGNQDATRQGIYMLTAGGKLLAYKNAGQNAEVMREVLVEALKKWKKLPESERTPGAVKVPAMGKVDEGFVRTPPEGGLVVNVHARALEKVQAGAGGVGDAVCKIGDGDEASRDHLWITREEWRVMVPEKAKVGDKVEVPAAVVKRIARFHLIDNTRGEPPMWEEKDVKAAEMAGVVEQADAGSVVVRLEGKALLAEGDFFRQVSDQGPRGKQNATRQGIYMFTAGGKLLAYKNAGQNSEVMREVLRDALAKWNKLPESERAPGAVVVPELGKVDGGYMRKPPAGGLIVNVHARALERKQGAGGLADAVCEVGDGDEASRDHLWITADEWRAMVPKGAKVGDEVKLPPAGVERIVRFHLIDNTRGEPPMWAREDVKASELKAVVQEADDGHVLVKLEGKVLLAAGGDGGAGAGADEKSPKRGFDAALLGYVRYDRGKDKVDRFDLVALGEHWGEGTYTRGARPGRQPFGIAFELADGTKPGDTVPPQAAREERAYFGPG